MAALFRKQRQPPKKSPKVEMTFDSRTEKTLSTLHPKMQEKMRQFLTIASPVLEEKGVVAKVISGLRSYDEQDALYAQGRTKPGRIVTNARAGYSNHNFGTAADLGLFKGEKYLPESYLYDELGPIGKSVGLEWGGDWKFQDLPHYQFPTGLTLTQMRERVAKGESVI